VRLAGEVLTLELSVSAKIYERVTASCRASRLVTCQPFVLHSVVKIRQQYEGHAPQVLSPSWAPSRRGRRWSTVVDEDVDIYTWTT
jgi:UbiD family decarboxylase